MANLAEAVDATETDWIISADLDQGIDFLTVESEVVKVTANFPAGRDPQTLTPVAPRIRVERGAGGTTAASHADGTALTPLIPPAASAGGGGGAIAVTDGAADEVLLQIDSDAAQTAAPLVVTTPNVSGGFLEGKLFEIKATGRVAIRSTDPNDVLLHVETVEAEEPWVSDLFSILTQGGDVFSVLRNGEVDCQFRGTPDGTPLFRLRPQAMDADPTADIFQVQNNWGEPVGGVTKQGYTYIQTGGAGSPTENVPPDAELVAGQMIVWFDDTDGAGKLMVKAKTANGTVRTGAVNLA